MRYVPDIRSGGTGGHTEFNAVRALEVDEAISFPCRWNHAGRGGSSCNAVTNIFAIARRSQSQLRSVCHEGTVYVGRTA